MPPGPLCPHLQHYRPRLGEKLGTSGQPPTSAGGGTRFSFNFGCWGLRRGSEVCQGQDCRASGVPSVKVDRQDQEKKRVSPRCAWHRLGLGTAGTCARPRCSASGPGSEGRGAWGRSRTFRMALGRETPDSCRAGRFLLPDTRTATLGSSPRTWRRSGRCVLTAAGGRAPGPAEILHLSHGPPGAPASPATHLLPLAKLAFQSPDLARAV